MILLLVPPPAHRSPTLLRTGVALVVVGELIRVWAVRHIGAISRTRSDRLGPLIATGPFALVRNPLYIGNALFAVGLTMSAAVARPVPVVLLLLAFEYHAIVRWEERLIASRLGEPYRQYLERVPRWVPRMPVATQPSIGVPIFSWRDTFFSERGTLLAIAAAYVVLWLRTVSW